MGTIKRILELINHFLENKTPKNYENIDPAELVPSMSPIEVRGLAKELFLIDSDILIMPVYEWDGEWVGDHFSENNSELFQVLFTILRQDMVFPGYDSSLLTPFEYKNDLKIQIS